MIYRSTGPSNRKRRPDYFDKLLSLHSFLRAVESCDGTIDIVFVNDGPIPDARRKRMDDAGRIIDLPGLGNSASYRHALSLATEEPWSDDDLAYFVEDDYLHLPLSLNALCAAANGIQEASYFTLYDHPDLYDGTPPPSLIYAAGGWHWRTAPSTCMTFAGRCGALRADRWIQRLATVPHTPRDQRMWHAVQRAGLYWVLPKPRHRLVGAVPGLATHLESTLLGPGVDWGAEAAATREWAERRGEPPRED